MFYIYSLTDPRLMQVFYVGCTAKPGQRYADHKKSPRLTGNGSNGRKVKARIAEIQAQGFQPIMTILEQTEDKSREKHWIRHCSFLGLSLVNTMLYRERKPALSPSEAAHQSHRTRRARKAERIANEKGRQERIARTIEEAREARRINKLKE